MKVVSIDEVRRRHKGHWFDADSMRFFRSRVADVAYMSEDGSRAYFVSSEKFVPSQGPAEARRYTIRFMYWNTGEIDTRGEFQQYRTLRMATARAIAFAMGRA